jgi:hypothetical protein
MPTFCVDHEIILVAGEEFDIISLAYKFASRRKLLGGWDSEDKGNNWTERPSEVVFPLELLRLPPPSSFRNSNFLCFSAHSHHNGICCPYLLKSFALLFRNSSSLSRIQWRAMLFVVKDPGMFFLISSCIEARS